MITIINAIQSLVNTGFKLKGNPSNETEFLDMFEIQTGINEFNDAIFSSDSKDFGITWLQLTNEIDRLQAAYDAAEYQRKRSAEYPPITDYLDGVVKGDQAQIDKYIADCLAVKAKYPKP